MAFLGWAKFLFFPPKKKMHRLFFWKTTKSPGVVLEKLLGVSFFSDFFCSVWIFLPHFVGG